MLRVAVARVAGPGPDGGDAMPGWLGDSERRRWTTLPPAARAAFAASRARSRSATSSTCTSQVRVCRNQSPKAVSGM